MRDPYDDITVCERLLISLCRQEHARKLRRQSLRLETWQPDSARKNRVRQLVTLSLDEEALYVGKIPLSAEDVKVAREYDILQRLKALNPNLSIAEPVCPVRRGFVMRYYPGQDFPQAVGPADSLERWLSLVRQVVDEIAVFHNNFSSADGAPAPEEVLRDYVDDWYPAHEETRRALAAARVGPTHGDLGPWNVRYDERASRIGIIDWEDFRPHGLPALDILNFLFTLPLLIHPDYREIGFDRLYELSFSRRGLLSRVVSAGLSQYARAVKVGAADLVALLPVYYRVMIVRFELEGRPTDNLFYLPFLRRFAMDEIVWLSELER